MLRVADGDIFVRPCRQQPASRLFSFFAPSFSFFPGADDGAEPFSWAPSRATRFDVLRARPRPGPPYRLGCFILAAVVIMEIARKSER